MASTTVSFRAIRAKGISQPSVGVSTSEEEQGVFPWEASNRRQEKRSPEALSPAPVLEPAPDAAAE